ncbi:hypothetical protein TELCIR_20656, partial [Teladorsagia circumcincta]
PSKRDVDDDSKFKSPNKVTFKSRLKASLKSVQIEARYRKAFEMSPLEHSGINLTTLLRASGEHFESNAEMQQIGTMTFLKSTMENIKLINRCAATISPIEK